MHLKELVVAVLLAVGTQGANAGNFVSLTNGNGSTLCSIDSTNPAACPSGGLVDGLGDPDEDPLYIQIIRTGANASVFATGAGYGTAGATPTVLNYNARDIDGNIVATSSLTLLASNVSQNVQLLSGIGQGTVYDFVFRDSIDNKLVFGTRFINQVDNDQEINYLFRQGAGDNPLVAWTRLSAYDLRMYQAGQTDDYSYDLNVDYEPGYVRMKADISVSEGNPWSGLYLVKTDATDYVLGSNAIGFYQAGEEGQAVVGNFIQGFVAVAAVPEPESYAFMLAGLGMIGVVSRRRKNK